MMSVGRVGSCRVSHGSVKATVTFQIKFCLLPLVSSDGENKSAEECAKMVISLSSREVIFK